MSKRRPGPNRTGPKKKRAVVSKSQTARKALRKKATREDRRPFGWLEVEILILLVEHRRDARYRYGMTTDEIKEELVARLENPVGTSKANIQSNVNKLRNRKLLEE